MNDDTKKKVLARRAKFVAAAIAGLGVACGKENAHNDKPPPGPCLSVAYLPPDASADASTPRPTACLAPPPQREAGPCNCQPGDPLCTCY